VNASQGGLLVPPNDPKALADAIATLVDNPALRRELGARGRASVERLYNSDRMAEATLAVYERFTSSAVNNRGS
jgi:glycosyltransferase involved in cell wall biosynthesis